MKHRIVVTAAAFLALAGMLTMPPGANAQSVFKAAYTAQPPTLDVMMSTTTAARQIAIYLFENLVTISEEYGVIPQLAESWEVSADGRVYTFKIRPGIKFHNGSDLDAGDVKASYERFAASPSGARLDFIESIEVVNDLTLKITCKGKNLLLESLAMPLPYVSILPSEIVAKYGQDQVKGDDVIGTGPVHLIDWTPDVAIRLGKFKDYKPDTRFDGTNGMGGRRVIHFDEIQIIPSGEASARQAGIETGDFDFAEDLPANTYGAMQSNPDITPTILKPKWGITMPINKAKYPTSDKYFRQALMAAMDAKEILMAVTLGDDRFHRLNQSIYTPEQGAFYVKSGDPEWYNKQDLAKARELLDKAGYKGEEMTYLCNRDYEWMYKTCLPLAAQWKAAGINVNLQFMDWPSSVQALRSQDGWHVHQSGMSPRFDPATNLAIMDGRKTAASRWYDNPQMNVLYEDMTVAAPLEDRVKAWTKIQNLFWEDNVLLRVGDIFGLDALRSNVKGFKPWYVTPRFWNVTK